MKYLTMSVAFACMSSVFSMPTKEELKAVAPVVQELMNPDLANLKAGRKSLAEVAESARGLVDHAESEASRLLLCRGAADLYARAGNVPQVIEILQTLRKTIPDIPNDELLKVAEDSARTLTRRAKVDLGPLRPVVAELRLRVQAASRLEHAKSVLALKPADAAMLRAKAESLAILGDWSAALEAFAKGDTAVAKFAKQEIACSVTADAVADFWWAQADSTKNQGLAAAFRRYAAGKYQVALRLGNVSGLIKMRAERRIADWGNVEDSCSFLRGGDSSGFPMNASALQLDLASSQPWLKPVSGSVPTNFSGSAGSVYKRERILLRRIPEGKFTMGASGAGVENEPHEVMLSRPFWASAFLVTRAQWKSLMPALSVRKIEEALGGDVAAATSVSRPDVERFCTLLNEKMKDFLPSGYVFRLPTLAENEYMLRAGCTGSYFFEEAKKPEIRLRMGVCEEGKIEILDGKGLRPDDKYWKIPANHISVEVGLREPNAWGLYDPWGNAEVFLMDVFPKSKTGFVGTAKDIPWKPQETDPLFWDADGVDGCAVFFVDTRKCFDYKLSKYYIKPGGHFSSLGFRLVLAPDLLAERGLRQ